jgi:response regulator RpfG family c-di-GMP phosphodiesterase
MAEEPIKFLIAEDEPAVRSLLCSVLAERDYHDIQEAGDGQEAIERIRKRRPDILITDLKMPRMGGEELARRALLLDPDLTILVTTGNGTIENAVRMIKEGVFDFITKPFSIETLNASIERGVERTRNLAELYGVRDVIEALMLALESKDIYLKGHSRRVSRMSGIVAAKLGWPRKRQRLLEYAALVHDVGKIGIQEQILNKPGPLTPWESSQMKMHPVYSRNILSPVAYLREALPDVYYHHERYDGGGYPEGLKGEAIPIGARIISICDSYDAMSSDRSYRSAMPEQDILEILKRMRGTQFDPALVDLFLENFAEIKDVHVLDHTKTGQT